VWQIYQRNKFKPEDLSRDKGTHVIGHN